MKFLLTFLFLSSVAFAAGNPLTDNIQVPKQNGGKVILAPTDASGNRTEMVTTDAVAGTVSMTGTVNTTGTMNVNGSTLTSGGVGQTNYNKFPNNKGLGWSDNGIGVVSSTETTTANIPKSTTNSNAVKLTVGSSGSGYTALQITLDSNAYNKVLGVSWAQKAGSGYVDGDLVFDVLECDAGWTNCSALPLSSDNTSNVTNLLALAQDYSATFVTTARGYLQLQWARNAGTGTNAWLALNDVVVSAGQLALTQSPVTSWQDYSSSFSIHAATSPTYPTPATKTAYWRRVGDSMEVHFYLKMATSGSFTVGSGLYYFPLPSGYYVDFTKVTLNTTVGHQYLYDGTSVEGMGAAQIGAVLGDGSQGVVLTYSSTAYNVTNVARSALIPVAANAIYTAFFTVPIVGWSTPLVTGAESTEYACNSNMTSASSDTTSFSYGPAGCTTPTALGSDITRRIQFQRAIQPTDTILVEFKGAAANASWSVLGADYDTGIAATSWQNVTDYGMGLRGTGVGTNYVTMIFARYSSPGAAYGGAGNVWSTALGYWRVKKVSAPALVGHNIAVNGNPGLISNYEEGNSASVTGVGAKFVMNNSGNLTGSNIDFRFTRIGNVVTLCEVSPSVLATANASDNMLTWQTTLLTRLIPTAASYVYPGEGCVGAGGNIASPCYIAIQTDGVIRIYKNPNADLWGAGSSGWGGSGCFTYRVN